MTELSNDTERELARLADGSLAGDELERARAHVRDSRELEAALAEQQRTVDLLAAVDIKAPESLHREVERMLACTPRSRARSRTPVARWAIAPRLRIAGALAAVIALVAVAVVSELGGSSALTVQQAAALTLSPATMTAPTESKSRKSQLSVAVGGVSFPYWRERFGWRGSGARSDRVAGHAITTVFYTNAEGKRIGYAIASGQAPASHGGSVVRRWGVTYRVLSHDGAAVIAWQREGHLCVVSGQGVSSKTLLRLASWGTETRA
jgi:hypothetical protein